MDVVTHLVQVDLRDLNLVQVVFQGQNDSQILLDLRMEEVFQVLAHPHLLAQAVDSAAVAPQRDHLIDHLVAHDSQTHLDHHSIETHVVHELLGSTQHFT